MKRFILVMVLIALVAMSGYILAAGSVSTTKSKLGGKVTKYKMSWVADASNGNVPSTASPAFNGYVLMVVTNPGVTAPTDNYDITLTDADGIDIMGAALDNRDTANTEQVIPAITGGRRFVDGGVTLLVTNTTNSSVGDVVIYVEEDK